MEQINSCYFIPIPSYYQPEIVSGIKRTALIWIVCVAREMSVLLRAVLNIAEKL